MLLFKFVGPQAVDRVFEDANEVGIRFGLPRGYNDPYELFLQPAPPLDTEEERAFYDYFLGKVAELPVACFSRRPDSLVMWAHYAREGTGMCLAFDEDALVDQLPVAYVGDISYSDSPASIDSQVVKYACYTGKRRHTLRLLEIGHRAAYFMKRTDWQYEHERRIVVTQDAVEEREGVLVGRIAHHALRHIILGPRVASPVRQMCEHRAQQYNVPLLQLRVGARTYSPFFSGTDIPAIAWVDNAFKELGSVCNTCGEPAIVSTAGKCEWCAISEDAREAGPGRSMLALSIALGIETDLPFVFDGMEPRGRLVRESNASKDRAT